MGYYIGLALMENQINLVNMKVTGTDWHLEKILTFNLDQTVNLTDSLEMQEYFKQQFKDVLYKNAFKGKVIGILIPSDSVIRRKVQIPYFIKPHIDQYIETNKTQFLPLREDRMTIAYEKCNSQKDSSYEAYHIIGIDHTFLAPFTIWLEDLGFHTQHITTIGDTLPYSLSQLRRGGNYCLIGIGKNVGHILFYEEGQCVYEHRIKIYREDPKKDAWEIFKIIQFMHPYEPGIKIEEVLCFQEEENDLIIKALRELENRKIEVITSDKTLNDLALIGLICQMDQGGKRGESCTYTI